jgi:hypothetical protein
VPRYSEDFRFGRGRGAGYDMEFGNWGARSGLTGGAPRGSARDPYDRAFRAFRPAPLGDRYDRGFRSRDRYAGDFHHESHGWGMTQLHQDMMHRHGEGFGYAGDYDRSHPARWRGEIGRGEPAPRSGWRQQGRWR